MGHKTIYRLAAVSRISTPVIPVFNSYILILVLLHLVVHHVACLLDDLVKKDGSALACAHPFMHPLTRDVGAAIQRYEQYNFDKMIYVVGSAQDFHLAQLFKILGLMGFPWAKNLLHINYDM